MQSRFTIALLALIAALAGPVTSLRAQEEGSGSSFITPFPLGDIYRVHVIGDDLADGLLYGLNEAFVGDGRLQLRPQHYAINGLMRSDFAQRLAQLDADLEKDPVNIAIVMMGAWDRASVRDASGRRAPVGSDAWRVEYGARADRLIKTLKKRNVAVYWVGLPNVRRSDANEDVQMMNNIVRERTYLNGFKYIDAYTGFMDETGGYSPYGPDVTGKIRVLRAGDGVYFTAAGNRKLAHFVERDLRRDLTQAKADRAIPLAGTEEEQAKINPDKAKLAEPAAPGAVSAVKPDPAAPGTPSAAVAEAGSSSGDQKADNGKINLRIIGTSGRDEVVTLDIVRPPIPASVVALVTRRESVDRPSQIGEAMIEQIPGGLTVMSTVALANTPGAGGTRSRLSPAQTPYFRVLFKGERLTPKPGRADDVSWPRPEPAADTAAVLPPEDDAGRLTTGATPAPVPAKRPAGSNRRE